MIRINFKNSPGFVVKTRDSVGFFNFELVDQANVKGNYWIADYTRKEEQITKKQWIQLKSSISSNSMNQLLVEPGILDKAVLMDANVE